MKQIIKNSYIKVFKFTSSREASTFVNNLGAKQHLYIDDSFGTNYYCYVNYNSLTMEKQFVLSFSSDEDEDNLNFLFWKDCIVLDTGKNIFFIDKRLHIKASFEVTTPLVGLFLVNKDNLLVLEEAYVRIVNFNGDIVKAELFDLIEDFSVNENLLTIRTSQESKVVKLA